MCVYVRRGWYLMLTLTDFGLSVLVVDADIVFFG